MPFVLNLFISLHLNWGISAVSTLLRLIQIFRCPISVLSVFRSIGVLLSHQWQAQERLSANPSEPNQWSPSWNVLQLLPIGSANLPANFPLAIHTLKVCLAGPCKQTPLRLFWSPGQKTAILSRIIHKGWRHFKSGTTFVPEDTRNFLEF